MIEQPQLFSEAVARADPHLGAWLRRTPWPWLLLAVPALGLAGARSSPADGLHAAVLGFLAALAIGLVAHARHRSALARDPRVPYVRAVGALVEACNRELARAPRVAARAATVSPDDRRYENVLSELRQLALDVGGLVQDVVERVRLGPPLGRYVAGTLRSRGDSEADLASVRQATARLDAVRAAMDSLVT